MVRFIQLTVMLALLLQAGCKSELQPDRQPPKDLTPNTQLLSYLALGDSYTIGESVAESERWPVQLADKLRSEDVAIAKPKIIARTGWTTDELQNAIDAAALADTFSLVSLLIGVNNQYRGYPFDQYETEFVALLERAIAFARGDSSRVLVLSIPDYGQTPFGQGRDPQKIGQELDQYNAYAKQVCESRGIAFYDITPISRMAPDDPALVAADGLHPSGKMYGQWVELIWQSVQGQLE